MKLGRCSACDGFVPLASLACPHCKTSSRLKILGGVVGGGVIAFTLMACYGRPPPGVADDAAPAPKAADAAPTIPAVDGGK